MKRASRAQVIRQLEELLASADSFRGHIEQQIPPRAGSPDAGTTLYNPERAPAHLRQQWERGNAVARYLGAVFPGKDFSVDYDHIRSDGRELLNLDTPKYCWVSWFLKVSDAFAAGHDRCTASLTASQAWSVLEVVEEIDYLYVSK